MEELRIGWLDKECVFHDCRYGQHATLAFKLIKKYKKEAEANGDWGVCEEGIDLGLICISTTSKYCSIELSKSTTQDQIKWLVDNRSRFSDNMAKTIMNAVDEYNELNDDGLWKDIENRNITMNFY